MAGVRLGSHGCGMDGWRPAGAEGAVELADERGMEAADRGDGGGSPVAGLEVRGCRCEPEVARWRRAASYCNTLR